MQEKINKYENKEKNEKANDYSNAGIYDLYYSVRIYTGIGIYIQIKYRAK